MDSQVRDIDFAKGTSLEASNTYGIALRALRAIPPSAGGLQSNEPDALIAIAFSAFAIEAFINEVHAICDAPDRFDPRLAPLAGALEDAERNKKPVIDKAAVMKQVLTGQPLDRGRKPWQDVILLYQMRDQIAHKKAQRLTVRPDEDGYNTPHMDPHALEQHLRSRRILAPVQPNLIESISNRMATLAAAGWACRIVVDAIGDVWSWFYDEEDPLAHGSAVVIGLYADTFRSVLERALET